MENIPLARIHGVNDLRLDSVPFPVCGADDVVVQVQQCGICGSDLGFLAQGGMMGPGDPLAIGHEFWGRVHQLGENVSHLKLGDAVVVNPLKNDNYIGNGGPDGGFSPYILVRNANVDHSCTTALPDQLPTVWGALVEPLAVALHSAHRIDVSTADKVVIFGAGTIGLSLLLLLNHMQVSDVVVVDLSSHRLSIAESMGAHTLSGDDPDLAEKLMLLHGENSLMGMPVAGSTAFFEMTGVGPVFENILQLAGPRSRVCLTGVHKKPVNLDLTMMLVKELSVVASMAYEEEFDQVIELLCNGGLDPSVLITHQFPLTQINEAFDTARDTGEAIKVMIDCQA